MYKVNLDRRFILFFSTTKNKLKIIPYSEESIKLLLKKKNEFKMHSFFYFFFSSFLFLFFFSNSPEALRQSERHFAAEVVAFANIAFATDQQLEAS